MDVFQTFSNLLNVSILFLICFLGVAIITIVLIYLTVCHCWLRFSFTQLHSYICIAIFLSCFLIYCAYTGLHFGYLHTTTFVVFVFPK